MIGFSVFQYFKNFNCFPGEIINPWTGGRLQLSDEIDENSAQDGKSNYFYLFIVNTGKFLHAPKIWQKGKVFFMFLAYVPIFRDFFKQTVKN